MREAGLFDSGGDLIVVAKMPETYKPQLIEGVGKELLIRIIIEKTSAESTPIRIDPAIATASRAYVDAEIVEVMELVAAEAAARQNHEADMTAHGSVPPGGIIMWSGVIDAVPQGWALCNGQNGTPDLRDRFVVGAGDSYGAGDIGGASVVTPSISISNAGTGVSVQGTTISTTTMPWHAHTVPSDDNDGGNGGADRGGTTGTHNFGTYGAGGSGAHAHGITDPGHTHTATTAEFENLPPFYALAFIMKL